MEIYSVSGVTQLSSFDWPQPITLRVFYKTSDLKTLIPDIYSSPCWQNWSPQRLSGVSGAKNFPGNWKFFLSSPDFRHAGGQNRPQRTNFQCWRVKIEPATVIVNSKITSSWRNFGVCIEFFVSQCQKIWKIYLRKRFLCEFTRNFFNLDYTHTRG